MFGSTVTRDTQVEDLIVIAQLMLELSGPGVFIADSNSISRRSTYRDNPNLLTLSWKVFASKPSRVLSVANPVSRNLGIWLSGANHVWPSFKHRSGEIVLLLKRPTMSLHIKTKD